MSSVNYFFPLPFNETILNLRISPPPTPPTEFPEDGAAQNIKAGAARPATSSTMVVLLNFWPYPYVNFLPTIPTITITSTCVGDSLPRHVSTQYPIWKTAYTKFRSCGTGQDLDIGWSIDDGHAKFMYNVNESICVSHDFEHNPISLKLYADHTNREQYKILTQLMGRVICTPKWDGRTDINIATDNLKTGGLAVKNRFTRGTFLGRNRAKLKVKHIRRSVNEDPSSDMKNVQTLCFGVADHANESYQDIQSKLVDLLALVDITVHSEIINNNRQKRVPLFLAKFIFVTGVKLLYCLKIKLQI